MAILTCQNLTLGYDNHAVVSGLNFSINEGDYLCIVGENGSGKTTLMKTILGLEEPLSGKVLTGDGLSQKTIGYLPQQSNIAQDFPAIVKEIVLSGCQNRLSFFPFYSKEDKKIANNAMKKIAIENLKNTSFRELSGGQQQRVLLARALAATKKMLFLDEPVTGLDPKATEEMYNLIQELNKEKITIIMISHDLKGALKYASHILHIGDTLFFGTKEEYLNSESYLANKSM